MLLLSVVSGSIVLHAAAQAPPGFDASWSAFRDAYKEELDAHGIVGGSVLMLRGGDVLAWETHGFADLETQRPVERETIFHWGSITKTLTGVAILQLRDRGLLTLDDPIVDYLPELRAVHNPFGDVRAITIRHVLSHAAGFRGPTWPWGGHEDWHPHEPTEWAQLVAMLPYTEILFEPGSRFSYSNPAIIFLGRIIEQLTGDDYEVYVDKNILRPLGMYRSYFDHTPVHLLKHRSNNYTVRDGVPVANGLDFDTGITVSNGGLNAPLGDMAAYLAFLAGSVDPDQQARYHEVLERSSLEEMWQPQHDAGLHGAYRQSIALAFFVMEKEGFRVVGHTGSQKAFLAFFYLDPATGAGVLAAFNTVGHGNVAPDTRSIMNALRERLFDDLLPLFQE